MCQNAMSFASNMKRLVAECVGTPYLLHGRSPTEGFDCYGLVWWIFAQVGIELPDFAYNKEWHKQGETYFDQHKNLHARAIAKSDAKIGDLVLFKMSRTTPNHIGIIVGDGKMAHCNEHQVVIVSYSQQPMFRKIEGFYHLHEIDNQTK